MAADDAPAPKPLGDLTRMPEPHRSARMSRSIGGRSSAQGRPCLAFVHGSHCGPSDARATTRWQGRDGAGAQGPGPLVHPAAGVGGGWSGAPRRVSPTPRSAGEPPANPVPGRAEATLGHTTLSGRSRRKTAAGLVALAVAVVGCAASAAGPARNRHSTAMVPRSAVHVWSHSITSSAAARSVAGTVSPSALAVLRLMSNSNVVGICTARSAGLSPRRMRLT